MQHPLLSISETLMVVLMDTLEVTLSPIQLRNQYLFLDISKIEEKIELRELIQMDTTSML